MSNEWWLKLKKHLGRQVAARSCIQKEIGLNSSSTKIPIAIKSLKKKERYTIFVSLSFFISFPLSLSQFLHFYLSISQVLSLFNALSLSIPLISLSLFLILWLYLILFISFFCSFPISLLRTLSLNFYFTFSLFHSLPIFLYTITAHVITIWNTFFLLNLTLVHNHRT